MEKAIKKWVNSIFYAQEEEDVAQKMQQFQFFLDKLPDNERMQAQNLFKELMDKENRDLDAKMNELDGLF
jgi:hypothetical protein